MWKGVNEYLGRRSKSSEQSFGSNNANSKSNNTNAIIHGDTNTVTNNYYFMGEQATNFNPNTRVESLTTTIGLLKRSSDSSNSDNITSSPSPFLLNGKTQNPEHNDTSPIDVPTRRVHWNPTNNNGEFNAPFVSVPEFNSRRLSTTSSTRWSILSESRASVPQPITARNVKKHLPEHTKDHIKAYMGNTSPFLDSEFKMVIPLWKPSPSIRSEAWTWKDHLYVGDVGTFNDEGGFDTIFNIFYSKDENLARGHDSPDDFACYPIPLNKLKLEDRLIEYEGPPIKGGQLNGFKAPSNHKQSDKSSKSPINSTYYAVRSNCFAIYLESGCRKVGLNSWDRSKVLKYARDNQDSWKQYVEEVAGAQIHDRPLLVIVSSYRTQSCALAARSKFTLKDGGITLRKLVEGPHTFYSWEVDNDLIHTESAPSSQFMESLDAYFKDMDEGIVQDCGPMGRKETRECHCVGITAYSLQKSRGAGSILTGRSSKTILQ